MHRYEKVCENIFISDSVNWCVKRPAVYSIFFLFWSVLSWCRQNIIFFKNNGSQNRKVESVC